MRLWTLLAMATVACGVARAPVDAHPTAASLSCSSFEADSYWIPVGKSPVLGPPDALVTIVEFSDFECPFCERARAPLSHVREAYGAKVRFVWKHAPLRNHMNAIPAANLSVLAHKSLGNEGFWKVHDALFSAQPDFTPSVFAKIANEAKLDVKMSENSYRNPEPDPVVAYDSAMASRAAIDGTPAFFINGRRLVGAAPFEEFRVIIDEELRQAEVLLKRGVPANEVYAKLGEDMRACGKGPRVEETR